MRTPWIAPALLLSLLAAPAAAQLGPGVLRELDRRVDETLPVPADPGAGLWEGQFAFDPEGEVLAGLVAPAPPPVTRATLEGGGEAHQRFRGLPGGIVLGWTARVPRSFAGARLERDADGALGLRLAPASGGAFLRAPALDAESLHACAVFVRAGLDGLVDLGADGSTRVAPAFEHVPLAELLVRMDRLPHALVLGNDFRKSLIVDRTVRVDADGERLVLAADLEARFYAESSGWALRAAAVEALSPATFGPRTATDLGPELAPLADLAGWLGFLRWAREADPAGFAAL